METLNLPIPFYLTLDVTDSAATNAQIIASISALSQLFYKQLPSTSGAFVYGGSTQMTKAFTPVVILEIHNIFDISESPQRVEGLLSRLKIIRKTLAHKISIGFSIVQPIELNEQKRFAKMVKGLLSGIADIFGTPKMPLFLNTSTYLEKKYMDEIYSFSPNILLGYDLAVSGRLKTYDDAKSIVGTFEAMPRLIGLKFSMQRMGLGDLPIMHEFFLDKGLYPIYRISEFTKREELKVLHFFVKHINGALAASFQIDDTAQFLEILNLVYEEIFPKDDLTFIEKEFKIRVVLN